MDTVLFQAVLCIECSSIAFVGSQTHTIDTAVARGDFGNMRTEAKKRQIATHVFSLFFVTEGAGLKITDGFVFHRFLRRSSLGN